MARPKRKSAVLSQAEERLLGMKLIDPKLNLGGDCSTSTIAKQITEVRKDLETYHALLTQADAAASKLEESEKLLSKLSTKVLKGVAVIYDQESEEYEMVGGVRPSDRKRSRRAVSVPAIA